jgi:hypothetical protein
MDEFTDGEKTTLGGLYEALRRFTMQRHTHFICRMSALVRTTSSTRVVNETKYDPKLWH